MEHHRDESPYFPVDNVLYCRISIRSIRVQVWIGNAVTMLHPMDEVTRNMEAYC